ncbi:MAG: RNA methyltransferase [Bacteroidota bacterium]
MSPTPLTSAQAQYIRQLKSKKRRFQENAFVVEGKKSVFDLLASDYTTQMVVVTPQFLASEKAFFEKKAIPLLTTTSEQLTKISSLQHNEHTLAVATMKPNQPLTLSPNERALVLDRIKDPGNLGTIMRIANWYGIGKIFCSPTTVDCYNSKVIQSSMGSFTHVESYYTPLAPFLEQTNLPVVGAVLESTNYLHTSSLPYAGLLLLGNESHGISRELYPFFTQKVTIQPHGKARSLNVAIATAVICEKWVTSSSNNDHGRQE